MVKLTRNIKKPAKLLDSKSLTLGFSLKQIWPVFLPEPLNWVPLRGDSGENVEISNGRLAQSANSPLYIMSFSGNLTDR